MTTEHLDIPQEDINKILGGVGKAVRNDNDDDLDKVISGIDAKITNLALGASAAIQRELDEQQALEAERNHRRAQREQIKNRAQRMLSIVDDEPAPEPQPAAPVVDEPAPANPPTAPQPPVQPDPVPVVVDEPAEDDLLDGLYTRDELMEMSNSDLQRLANEYGIDIMVNDDSLLQVIALIIVAQSEYCQREDVVDPNRPNNDRPTLAVRIRDSRHNPRSWNIWQWVGAIIGALIGILIYRITNDWEQDITGFWNRVFDVLLFVSLVGLGFFGGAELGARVEDRQESLRSRS